ncbi:MAG: DUF2232 domain-containing protein [Alphaproteobacteria bacterium]|nr:DUF2232 domain-containing protein [Alphaproteobacteria bacterium]
MSEILPVSRGLIGHLLGVLAGLASAGLCAFAGFHAESVLILMAYFLAIPLYMAGFACGALSGFLACLAGVAGVFAFAPAGFGIFYLFFDAIPAAILILLAMGRRVDADGAVTWRSEGTVLAVMTLYPCLIFMAVFVIAMGHDGGLQAMTLHALDGMSDQVTKLIAADGQKVTPEIIANIHQAFGMIARIMPAFVMCVWLFSTFVDMAVAQSFVGQRQWKLRPAFTLGNLHVPSLVVFAAAIVGLVAVFAPEPYRYVGLNLGLVLGVPFFFSGLAVIHGWAARTAYPGAVLAGFYILLVAIVYLAFPVTFLGVLDQWVNFRKRFAEPKN